MKSMIPLISVKWAGKAANSLTNIQLRSICVTNKMPYSKAFRAPSPLDLKVQFLLRRKLKTPDNIRALTVESRITVAESS